MKKVTKKITMYLIILSICFVATITVFAATSASKTGTATYLTSIKLPRIDIAGTPGDLTTVTSHLKATQWTTGGASIKTTFDVYSATGAFNSSKSAVTSGINNANTIYYQFLSNVRAGWKTEVSFKGNGIVDQVIGTFGAYS